MRRIKPLHLFWKRIALFNIFIKNIHVSLFSINLCLENGPGKSVFENVFVKYTKYGGSNTNTNTNTWFEIWSNTNTNTNTPYLYLYLYLQIQIRIWPQPCKVSDFTIVHRAELIVSKYEWPRKSSRAFRITIGPLKQFVNEVVPLSFTGTKPIYLIKAVPHRYNTVWGLHQRFFLSNKKRFRQYYVIIAPHWKFFKRVHWLPHVHCRLRFRAKEDPPVSEITKTHK